MRNLLLTCLTAAAFGSPAASAAINIPSDGSDGELVITTNTEIDLSQAATGNWDANNSANAGKGIYDPTKWAVVFKYSSVTINAGATVTFKNHPSYAPVVWLVSGDVTINGAVDLSGKTGGYPPWLATAGPGGFRGGTGYLGATVGASAGFGVGGGATSGGAGHGGSYGSAGGSGPSAYGNPSVVPLIGGSGGAGDSDELGSGGSGGGAILVASSSTITLGSNGAVRANGGEGPTYAYGQYLEPGGGSGGAIRLVADRLAGAGQLRTIGGPGKFDGGVGRIRLERVVNAGTTSITPDPSVLILADGASPVIWLPETGPTAKIVSVGGAAAPADPRPGFDAAGADVTLPQVTTTHVVVETTNVEQASEVKVRTTPRASGNYTETTATVDQVVSETPLVIRWKATVPVNNGYSAMQVRVVRP